MSQWIYEQDLVAQKYRILIPVNHDRIIRQIAADLGVGLQELRRFIIEHCDMLLIENLPARYEAAQRAAAAADPVARAIGRELYTSAVPLVPAETMDAIYREATAKVVGGMPVDAAVAEGKNKVREAMGL
jgi:energy-converting hydrogenase A subunit M